MKDVELESRQITQHKKIIKNYVKRKPAEWGC
jgi:hypothetical protein